MLALDVHDEHRARQLVHRADAVEELDQPGGFAADHGLFLFDVIVDGAVGLHLLDLLEPGDGALDGREIGQRAAQPAFGDIELAAFFGGLFDGLLSLLLGPDEEHLAAFAHV